MARRIEPQLYSVPPAPCFETSVAIRGAILRRELYLEFQPKVNLSSGLIEGVEALVRWNHPQMGRLGPDAFLHDLERTSMMSSLTDYVLEEALSQCAAFHAGGVLIGVAVNVSPTTITRDLADRIYRSLERHHVQPQWLTIEVTQTTGFEDIGNAAAVMSALRAGGIHVSLDDFGTGYATLSHVQTLPIDEIKIDQSFVANATDSPRDAAIVRFTAELSRALGLRLVAEGVENEETLRLLKACGVDAAQGFYFATPLRASNLIAQLHEITNKAQRRAGPMPIDLRGEAGASWARSG